MRVGQIKSRRSHSEALLPHFVAKAFALEHSIQPSPSAIDAAAGLVTNLSNARNGKKPYTKKRVLDASSAGTAGSSLSRTVFVEFNKLQRKHRSSLPGISPMRLPCLKSEKLLKISLSVSERPATRLPAEVNWRLAPQKSKVQISQKDLLLLLPAASCNICCCSSFTACAVHTINKLETAQYNQQRQKLIKRKLGEHTPSETRKCRSQSWLAVPLTALKVFFPSFPLAWAVNGSRWKGKRKKERLGKLVPSVEPRVRRPKFQLKPLENLKFPGASAAFVILCPVDIFLPQPSVNQILKLLQVQTL